MGLNNSYSHIAQLLELLILQPLGTHTIPRLGYRQRLRNANGKAYANKTRRGVPLQVNCV
jgi:hypothetical protein